MSNFKVGDKVRCRGQIGVIEDVDYHDNTAWVEFEEDSDYSSNWFAFRNITLIESFQKPRDFLEGSGKPPDLPKYVLVEAKKDEFLKQVNELIAQGYKPQGGVAVDQQYCIQAMILED